MGTAEFLRLLMDQNGADQPGGGPRDLLRWAATRVLLGMDTAGAAASLQEQVAALEPTSNVARDVYNWTRYAAILELLGVSGEGFAAASLAYFNAQPALDRDDRDVAACGLSLSLLATGGSSAAPEWLAAARSFPSRDSAAEGFFYEPVFLATHAADLDTASVSLAASLTARLLFNEISGAPQNSAAPAVCALAAVARRHGSSAHDLLFERLSAIDEVAGDFDKPRIHFKTPVFRSDAADVEMRVTASGEGELDTGAYPVEPLTWLFRNIIAGGFDLTRPEAALRVRLILPAGIAMPPESEAFLNLRNAFSWDWVCSRLPELRCSRRFEVQRK